jgi:signal transduction histidine kinase
VRAVLGSASRLPRGSIRLRLTLLYGGLFLATGAALLFITYLLMAHTTALAIYTRDSLPAGSGSLAPNTIIELTKQQVAADRASQLRHLLTVSAAALLGMAAISVLAGWWMAGRALRPVRAMTDKARRLSEANLHERLAVSGPDDELKRLGDTFDGLLGRLDSAFEAERRFVANASHELRTPLTLQRAMIEIALADPDADAAALRRVCERVLAAGSEQERTIEALLTLARGQRGLERREPVDLAALASRVAGERNAAPAAAAEPVQLSVEAAASHTAGDARLLERLVGNLVDNALRHNVSGGWAVVRTGTHQGCAMLQVANSGPVIPRDRVELLVQPFQRLESRTGPREGHGLGLSIAAAIAGAHGARLAIEPLAGGGLDVTVAFPAAPPATLPAAAVTSPRARTAADGRAAQSVR